MCSQVSAVRLLVDYRSSAPSLDDFRRIAEAVLRIDGLVEMTEFWCAVLQTTRQCENASHNGSAFRMDGVTGLRAEVGEVGVHTSRLGEVKQILHWVEPEGGHKTQKFTVR